MSILTRSTQVPTPAERLAAWAYRYKLIKGPEFNSQFTFKAGKQ